MANTTIVGTLRTLLVADASQFEEVLKRSTTTAQGWAKNIGAIGTQAASVGQVIADKLTGPLATLGTTAQSATTAIQTSLGGMKSAFEASQGEVQKLGDSFRTLATAAPGAAMAGSAKTAATAVDGLTKSGTAAAEAFRQLGTEAPQQIGKVGTAAKDAKGGVEGIVGSAKGIAGALGIGLSVKAVVDFGSKIIEDAGHIADLSAKIGISTDAVQRFGFAAEQTGASMDVVAGAIGKMNVTLAGGDKSTIAALDSIGLKFSDIRAMKPEDAFRAITEAIAKIADPMLQAEAATKLFGKTGQELLPAIRQGFQDVAASAPVMADAVIQATDRVGDQLARMKRQALNAGGEVVGGLAIMAESNYTFIDEMNTRAFQSIDDLAKRAKASAAGVKAALGLDKPLTGPDALAGLPMGLGGPKTGADELRIATDLMKGLTAAQKENIDALAALGKSTDEIATKTNIAADVVKLYTDAQKKSADAQKKAADTAQQHLDKIRDMAAAMSGVGLSGKVKDLNEAVALMALQFGRATMDTQGTVEAVQALAKQGAALTPILTDIYLRHLDWNGAIGKVQIGIKGLIADLPNYTQQMKNFMAVQNFDVTKMPVSRQIGTGDLLKGLPNLAPAFKSYTEKNLKSPWMASMGSDLASSLPSTLMSGFSAKGTGKVASNMGAQLGGTLAQSAGKMAGPAISKALGPAIGKGMGAAIGGLAGNAIPIVGPIIGQMVGGLIDKAMSHKGRDAAVAFADSMGGFDELHTKLGTLGAEGEKMWTQLTGVGKKDEKGAQKIIANIQKAFEDAEKKAAELQARLEKVNQKFSELGGALQDFGGVVPASMRPLIDNLLKSTDLTAEMKKTLQGFAKDPSWQTLEKKATDLGINLKGMGKQFQQAKLGDIAFGYVHDLQMFADSGADMQIVIEGMSDELSTLYSTALSTGAKLPNTLKPYMQTLVDQGLLLDENGKKVDHLNDDTFADIEDKGLKDVVSVLESIRDLLKDSLPKAADEGAKAIQDNFNKAHLKLPVDIDYNNPTVPPPGSPGAPGGGEDPGTGGPGSPPRGPIRQPQPGIGLQGGTYGQFIDWGAGTPVTLHGKEAVVPYGSGGGAVNITVVSQLDGREVARNQVRYIPDSLRRAGI